MTGTTGTEHAAMSYIRSRAEMGIRLYEKLFTHFKSETPYIEALNDALVVAIRTRCLVRSDFESL